MYRKILKCFLLMAALPLQAYFCACTPPDYQDFRFFIAPQIARLKFQVQDLAIYRGVFKGGSVGFEYRPFCTFYGGAFSEWMMGSCDSEMQMSRYIHDIDSQARFGYSFPMWNFYKLTFTPFSGLGYIYVVQHLRSDLVISSEKFRYYTYYIPVGGIIDLRINPSFRFGFVIQWKPAINERVRTPYIHGVRFDLKKMAGYSLEVPFNMAFGSPSAKAEISIIPYLTRAVDGRLRARLPNGATLTLPQQEYKFWGLRLTLGATF